jgi:DNA-binding NarL/FixJ family response regulator
VRISDWLSQRQWRDNPLFRESYRHLGIGDQIAVHTQILDRQVSAAGVSLGRDGRTYSDGERDVLRLVTPHLVAALRRAAAAPVRTAALRVAPVLEVASVGGALPQLASAVDPRLTAREAEVLSLVATGLTDHQIARRLGVRPRTVSKHLEHVYSKLGVTNRLAALRAVSAGMKRLTT